jgi:hypothetical protein
MRPMNPEDSAPELAQKPELDEAFVPDPEFEAEIEPGPE